MGLREVRVDRRLTLDEAAALHGHRGPWLVLGYRAGLLAVRELCPEGELEMECLARLPQRRPFTCALDGIQASSRCTLGKGNIRSVPSDSVEFEFRSASGSLLVRVRPEVVGRLLEMGAEGRLRDAADWIESADPSELFEVVRGRTARTRPRL